MRYDDRHRRFTLTVVPDCGTGVKTSPLHLRAVFFFLGGLAALFLFCLAIIVGYHIKLYQEHGYRAAVATGSNLHESLMTSARHIDRISERLTALQRVDRAFRHYARMQVPDENMYRAGVGGHQLVDDTLTSALTSGVRVTVNDLLLKVSSLERQVTIAGVSIASVRAELAHQIDIANHTPSILPTQSLNITSPFGSRRNPVTGARQFHDAVDFTGRQGDKIYATADGTVSIVEFDPIRGNYIEIEHRYGYRTQYAHLRDMFVTVGQPVKRYDVIGSMGNSGRTTGVNLHYVVIHYDRKVNPVNFF